MELYDWLHNLIMLLLLDIWHHIGEMKNLMLQDIIINLMIQIGLKTKLY